MRKKITQYFGLTLVATIILFMIISFSDNAFAKPASETESPVDSDRTKHLEYSSIFDLLPNDLRAGNEIYIPREYLKSEPSILCSYKGTKLPGKEDTKVQSGGRSARYKTDQGKLTGFLTLEDKGSTVYKDGKKYKDQKNPFSKTTSHTYGKFKLVDTYPATPAEAWVLTELDMNDPSKNINNLERTNEVYMTPAQMQEKHIEAEDIENPEHEYKGLNGLVTWAVEWKNNDSEDGEPTKFVTKVNDTYYIAKVKDGEEQLSKYPLYVQHAWWKVKEVGTPATGTAAKGIRETDLQYEAEEFEKYIARIAKFSSQTVTRKIIGVDIPLEQNWQWNEDYTIQVDYKNYTPLDSKSGAKRQLGYDASKYEVRFNPETNKYIVGPFKINYLRAGTKQGKREKVSFSGITQSTLYGLDAEGNRMLTADGESVLQQRTALNPNGNYSFVYDHVHEDYIPTITNYRTSTPTTMKLDTEEDYPFPYDDEEFYISIDYLDDLVSLESLDFDFQYMNAGALFEYLEGTTLEITWLPRGQYIGPSSGSGSSMLRTNENISLGMAEVGRLSNRDGESGGTSEFDITISGELSGSNETYSRNESEGDWGLELSAPDNYRAEKIKGSVKCNGKVKDEKDFKITSGTVTYSYENSKAGSKTATINENGEFEIDREFDSPIERLKEFKVEVKYQYKVKNYNKPYGDGYDTIEDTITIPCSFIEGRYLYYNDILAGTVKFKGNCAGYRKNGNSAELHKLGVVRANDLIVGIMPKYNENVGGKIDGGKIVCDFGNGTKSEKANASETDWIKSANEITPKDSPYTVTIKVISDIGNITTETATFSLNMKTMFVLGSAECNSMPDDASKTKSFYVYNIYKDLTYHNLSENDKMSCTFVSDQSKEELLNGVFTYHASKAVKESITKGESLHRGSTYTYRDGITSIKISLNGKLTSEGEKEEDVIEEAKEAINNSYDGGSSGSGGSHSSGGSGSGGGSGGGSGSGSGDASGSGGGSGSGDGSEGRTGSEDGSGSGSDDGDEKNIPYEEELTRLIEDLTKKLAEAKKELEGYETEFKKLQPEASEQLKKEYDENVKKLEELNKERDTLIKRREELDHLIATEQNLVLLNKYKIELETVKYKIAALEAQITNISAKINNLALQYNNLAELVEINKQLEELQKAKEEAEKRVSDAEGKVHEANIQYEKNEEAIDKISNDENSGNEIIEKLRKELEQTKQQYEQSSKTLEGKRIQLSEKKKQYEDAQKNNNDNAEGLRNEVAQLEAEVAVLENQNEENRTRVERLTEEFEKSKSDQGRALIDRGKQISSERTKLADEMTEEYKKLYEIQNEINDKLARQKKLMEEVDEILDKDLSALTKKITETKRKIQNYEDIIARLKSALNASKAQGGKNGSTSSGDTVGGGSGYWEFWLKYTSASEKYAQHLVQGREPVKKNIDAMNGRGADAAGEAVHLQIFPKKIDLRTRLGGMVWIDEEPQKGNGSGELGTKDGKEKPAAQNSVEIVVWKVKYDIKANKEVERTKAVAWKGTENKDGSFKVDRKLDFVNNNGRLYVDNKGEYTVDKIQVPSEEGLNTNQYRISYDIEFVYDGQTYEATEFLKSTGKDKVADKVTEFKKTADETKGASKDYEKYKNDSYIVENAEERKDFDSYFTEVYGKNEMKITNGQNGVTATTEGSATGGKGTGNEAKSQYEKVTYGDKTKDKEAELHYESTDVKGETTRKNTKLITTDKDGFVLDQYKFAARTSEAKMYYAYEGIENACYHVKKDYYDNMTTSYIDFKKMMWTSSNDKSKASGGPYETKVYKPIDEYFTQINLGLVERYKTDISVLKDLYKAKVVVAEQENDYRYNAWGELTEESLNKRVEAGYRKQTYNIGLYNSDYNYRSSVYDTVTDPITKTVLKAIKDESELRLFVTYRIAITNESELTDVSINEFKDYYDKSFTLVGSETKELAKNADTKEKLNINEKTGEISAYIDTSNTKEIPREEKIVAFAPYYRKLSAGATPSELYSWNRTDDLANKHIDKKVSNPQELATGKLDFTLINSGNSEFKGSVTSGLNALSNDGKSVNPDMTLEPGEKFEVFVTYEVDQEKFKQIQDSDDADRDASLLGTKYNVAEISTYSTAYTTEHVGRHKTTSFKAGQVSGRIDQDSAPDNIIKKNMKDDSIYEDDTEAAPVVSVGIKPNDASREINGTVWEDSRGDYEEGDGIYDPNTEQGIDGVDATLVEKIKVAPSDTAKIVKYAEEHRTEVGEEAYQALCNPGLDVLDYEFEFIWPNNTFDRAEGPEYEFNSKATTSGGGNYKFRNMVSGNYVVRFEYGNNDATLKYNGQDYKNTAYQTGMLNASAQKNEEGKVYIGNSDGTVQGDVNGSTLAEAGIEGTRTTLNNEWHDLSDNQYANTLNEARVSDARDYEPRRLQVNAYSRTITNENAEVLAAYINDQEKPSVDIDYYKTILEGNKESLKENTKMVANTAKITIDIEKQSEIQYDPQVSTAQGDQNTNGEADINKINSVHDYTISNVDFGLVKRPETRLYIQKEIAKIELKKNEGKDVVLSVSMDDEGNIIKAGGTTDQGTVSVNRITEINKNELVGQGFKYVAIEASYARGMDVELTYQIKLYNRSELDYTTEEIAKIKNIQKLYDKASDYESHPNVPIEDAEYTGLSPFNTGKGIVYGQLVGLHYYTNNTDATGNEDLSNKYKYSYNNTSKDVLVTTTVDQLVDYIDNDIVRNQTGTDQKADQAWLNSSEADRVHKLSDVAYAGNTKFENDMLANNNLQDNNNRSYVEGTGRNNIAVSQNDRMIAEPIQPTRMKVKLKDSGEPETKVQDYTAEDGSTRKAIMPVLVPVEGETVTEVYTIRDDISGNENDADLYNSRLTRQLWPEKYVETLTSEADKHKYSSEGTIRIITSQIANEENLEKMIYDNLVEILMYSNTVGRRDMQAIPGNANMIAKELPAYNAGYDRAAIKDANGNVEKIDFTGSKDAIIKNSKSEDVTIKTERDAYAAKDTVTFSEPTGLSLARQKANTLIRVILISLIIAAITLMTATVIVVIKKTKTYDDSDLVDNDKQ